MIKFIGVILVLLSSQGFCSNVGKADVTKVTVSGINNSYRFSVTLDSDDTGCKQYADWWEIVSEDGDLLYRRILAHSHVSEKPFTRSLAGINIKRNALIYIRAHMNNRGYKGNIFKGSIKDGFKKLNKAPNFSNKLDSIGQLPKACLY